MTKILEAMKQARANIEIEGLYIPNTQEELVKKLLKGEISEPDYFLKVLEIVKK
jgi:hypothetical protein